MRAAPERLRVSLGVVLAGFGLAVAAVLIGAVGASAEGLDPASALITTPQVPASEPVTAAVPEAPLPAVDGPVAPVRTSDVTDPAPRSEPVGAAALSDLAAAVAPLTEPVLDGALAAHRAAAGAALGLPAGLAPVALPPVLDSLPAPAAAEPAAADAAASLIGLIGRIRGDGAAPVAGANDMTGEGEAAAGPALSTSAMAVAWAGAKALAELVAGQAADFGSAVLRTSEPPSRRAEPGGMAPPALPALPAGTGGGQITPFWSSGFTPALLSHGCPLCGSAGRPCATPAYWSPAHLISRIERPG